MTTFDFSPLFRSTVGFDRLANLMDTAMNEDTRPSGYPPHDVEVVDEDRYRITVAVAGFTREDLSIEVKEQTLTVTGKKPEPAGERRFLHHGIARRGFVQKFRLADHVKVTGADLDHGMLTVNLEREVPEAMKPRTIAIGDGEARLTAAA